MGGPDQKGYSMGRSGLKVWVGKGGGQNRGLASPSIRKWDCGLEQLENVPGNGFPIHKGFVFRFHQNYLFETGLSD